MQAVSRNWILSSSIQCLVGFAAIFSCTSSAYAVLYGAQPSSGKIVQIDPETGSIVRSISAPDSSFDYFVGMTGAENGSVLLWRCVIGDTTQDRLTRIDPISGNILDYYDGLYLDGPVSGLTSERVGNTDLIVESAHKGDLVVQSGYGSPNAAEYGTVSSIRTLGGDGQGRSFAATFDGMIDEFDAQTGSVLNSFAFDEPVTGLAFDGQNLFAAVKTLEGSAFISELYTLNPDTGQIIRSVPVEGGAVNELAVAVPEPALVLPIALSLAYQIGRRR